MPARRARNTTAVVSVVVGVVLAAGIIGGGVYLQKAGERQAYQAVTAGPRCRAVAAAPAFVDRAALKTASFGGVSFHYIRGDADCQTVRPGRLSGDGERPYCLFDHPGYVEATAGAVRAAYVVPVGQASVLAEDSGFRCALQPNS